MSETNEACLRRVRQWRWPDGIRCPHCGAARWGHHARPDGAGRPTYRCGSCLRTFNDLTGTPFARSRLPLEKWFECAASLCRGRATCAELARRLDVKVATAWRMRTVLRRSFSGEDFERLFAGDGR